MIQTAAPSVSSSLSLAAAIMGAPADDAAASGDFAALLDAKVSPNAAGVHVELSCRDRRATVTVPMPVAKTS